MHGQVFTGRSPADLYMSYEPPPANYKAQFDELNRKQNLERLEMLANGAGMVVGCVGMGAEAVFYVPWGGPFSAAGGCLAGATLAYLNVDIAMP